MREYKPHVTSEVRTIYRSARGYRLQKRAAYLSAAKALIADACRMDVNKRIASDPFNFESCDRNGFYQCRFHKVTEPELAHDGEPVGEYGMLYYAKVLPRLARFLRWLDERNGVTHG